MASKAIEAGRAFLRLLVDDADFGKGIDAGIAKLDSLGKSAQKIGVQVGAAGAAITAPFVASLKVFADVGSALNDMSVRTGISVETLSELKFAAEQTGTSLGDVENGLRRMQRTLGDAATGSKEANDALAAIGLTITELRGLSPAEQYERISKAISAIEDPTQRAAAAMEIFGRSGTALLPMISQSEELSDKFREMGLVWTTEMAESADALGDAVDVLKAQFVAMAGAIAEAVAPAVTSIIENLSSALKVVIDFTRENRLLVQIIGTVGAALTGLGTALATFGTLARGAAAGITAIRIALNALAKHPYAILITVGLTAVIALLGPMIDNWLGVSEATETASQSAAKSADAHDRVASSIGKTTKAIELERNALSTLNDEQRTWLGLARDRAGREAVGAKGREFEAQAIGEQIKSVDASISAVQRALDEQLGIRGRLQEERRAGGSGRFQENVSNAIAANERERARLSERLVTLEKNRTELAAQQSELTGEAQKKREEIAKREKRDAEQLAEKRKREQEQARREAERMAEQRRDELSRLSESVSSQFESVTRPLRSGFGSRLAEQIAGSSAADSTEQRMLKLEQKQVELLGLIRTDLQKAGVLMVGSS